MSKVVDIGIKEYKKIRYIVIPNNDWGYGYILIDKKKYLMI